MHIHKFLNISSKIEVLCVNGTEIKIWCANPYWIVPYFIGIDNKIRITQIRGL